MSKRSGSRADYSHDNSIQTGWALSFPRSLRLYIKFEDQSIYLHPSDNMNTSELYWTATILCIIGLFDENETDQNEQKR